MCDHFNSITRLFTIKPLQVWCTYQRRSNRFVMLFCILLCYWLFYQLTVHREKCLLIMTMGLILYFNKCFVHLQLFFQNPENKSLTLCTLVELSVLQYIIKLQFKIHNVFWIATLLYTVVLTVQQWLTMVHIANAVNEHACVHYVDGVKTSWSRKIVLV